MALAGQSASSSAGQPSERAAVGGLSVFKRQRHEPGSGQRWPARPPPPVRSRIPGRRRARPRPSCRARARAGDQVGQMLDGRADRRPIGRRDEHHGQVGRLRRRRCGPTAPEVAGRRNRLARSRHRVERRRHSGCPAAWRLGCRTAWQPGPCIASSGHDLRERLRSTRARRGRPRPVAGPDGQRRGHAGRPSRIEFGADVADKQDLPRLEAHVGRDAGVAGRLPLGAGGGVVVAAEKAA